MIARLMLAHSTVNPEMDLHSLPTLLGRYFQIRDDYQNLVSPDVSGARLVSPSLVPNRLRLWHVS